MTTLSQASYNNPLITPPSHFMPQKVRGWVERLSINKCLLIQKNIAGQQILSTRFFGYHFLEKVGGDILFLGYSRHGNVLLTCHFIHLAKIQGMKSISTPRLLVGIYTFWKIISFDEYRKKLWRPGA
jgi:hypothetical protein